MTSNKPDQQDYSFMQPNQFLWSLYHPQNAPRKFSALTFEQAIEWQVVTRKALENKVMLPQMPNAQYSFWLIENVDCGDYFREKIIIQTTEMTHMPVYLLIPKFGPKPYPTVLAFHGHGYGVKDIVGLWEDGSVRKEPDGYHKDFAISLCRKGFAVAAPEISCFGERQTDFSYLDRILGQPVPSTCTNTTFLAFYLGGTTVGLRVFDAMRLVDYLESRSDFDTSALGAMGISGGGMLTFFASCLDTRIKACVVSGYFSTFAASILAMDHCPCNYIPGLNEFGEMYDLIGLIAPRPVLIEAATKDPIFPIQAVRNSVLTAKKVYKILGNEKGIETDYFEGRHEISGRKAYDFLWTNLRT